MASTATFENHQVFYVRHAKSESNRTGNTGVHTLDPMLMSGDEDREHGFTGQTYCVRSIAPRLRDKNITNIAVSPLIRCISTLILSLPLSALFNVNIVVMPLLEEQTTWFSDRPRGVGQCLSFIKKLLRAREVEHSFSLLKIDFSHVLAEEDSGDDSQSYTRFETISLQGLNSFRAQQDILARSEKLNKPWHTKTGIYHPTRLHDRGTACTAQLALWMSSVLCENHEAVFAIFGHGGFASFITEEVGDIRPTDPIPKLTDWKTGEVRRYTLEWFKGKEEIESGLLREAGEDRSLRLGPECQPYELVLERNKARAQQQGVVDIARRNLEDPAHKALYLAAESEIPSEVQGADESYLKEVELSE